MDGRVRKQELVRILEGVPPHPAARPEWEQYATPGRIAAELLWVAKEDGAIVGKRVLDLGCGTGVFTLGAALLGASVHAVDIDPAAIALARDVLAANGVGAKATFEAADLSTWHAPASADTVVMNPPFGAQKANRNGDRLFYERALEAVGPAGTVWFLAQENSERFLGAFASERGLGIEKVASWDYPLEATMAFHQKGVSTIRVGGYRLAR